MSHENTEYRYCGAFGKIEGFSIPDYPEAALELRHGATTHLIIIADHDRWISDYDARQRNLSVAAFLRSQGVTCPDMVLMEWVPTVRGRFSD